MNITHDELGMCLIVQNLSNIVYIPLKYQPELRINKIKLLADPINQLKKALVQGLVLTD